MKLTVAIPTYNRNDILKENIALLLPQLNSDCKLLVIDNHSETPVAETLKYYISEFSHVSIEVIRNRVNIGGNANILRCIEYCETEYLWILSDDDPVLNNAVETIFKYIHEDRLYDFINFSIIETNKEGQRKSSISTRGPLDFVKNIDSYGRVLLISSNIYRVTDRLKSQLSMGNFYQYCCAPHLLTLILSLTDNSLCFFSNESIVNHCSNDTTPAAIQGSPVVWALGMPTILDVPLDNALRHELKNKLVAWMSPRAILRQLLLTAVYDDKTVESKYYYKAIKKRLFSLGRALQYRILIIICDLLIINPKLGLKIFSYFYTKSKGKVLSKDSIAGRLS